MSMNNFRVRLVVAMSIATFLMSGFASAQTLTINSVSATQFCEGDPISVSFTASGAFEPSNVYRLQILIGGSFTNIASIKDSTGGTKTISTTIPSGLGNSSHYRLRISSAAPYVLSSDNGSDIGIGSLPTSFYISAGIPAGIFRAGTPSEIGVEADRDLAGDSIFFDFGTGASPATLSALIPSQMHGVTASYSGTTTYSTLGSKMVTARIQSLGGCSETATNSFSVVDFCKPAIPKDAIVIRSDTTMAEHGGVYWVNPGVTLTFLTLSDAKPLTIFAEPGASIPALAQCNIAYLKAGASYKCLSVIQQTIVEGTGTSISLDPFNNATLVSCPNLDFDYTNAPPNAAFPSAGVAATTPAAPVELFPNPASGIVTVSNAPADLMRVDVLNVLGAEVKRLENIHSGGPLQFDVATLPAGIYYIRFATPTSVATRKIVRE